MSIGTMINRALDAILPDPVGDAVGAFVDGVSANPVGAVRNTIDLCEDVVGVVADDAPRWLGLTDDALRVLQADEPIG
jgi:hypothetical protein